jgi:hypothetical protein
MNLLTIVAIQRPVRFFNHITGTISNEVDVIYDYDHSTRERIEVGRICRCGDCTCCKTKAQADEHGEILLALNNIKP